jgi:hypothetical protein
LTSRIAFSGRPGRPRSRLKGDDLASTAEHGPEPLVKEFSHPVLLTLA